MPRIAPASYGLFGYSPVINYCRALSDTHGFTVLNDFFISVFVTLAQVLATFQAIFFAADLEPKEAGGSELARNHPPRYHASNRFSNTFPSAVSFANSITVKKIKSKFHQDGRLANSRFAVPFEREVVSAVRVIDVDLEFALGVVLLGHHGLFDGHIPGLRAKLKLL